MLFHFEAVRLLERRFHLPLIYIICDIVNPLTAIFIVVPEEIWITAFQTYIICSGADSSQMERVKEAKDNLTHGKRTEYVTTERCYFSLPCLLSSFLNCAPPKREAKHLPGHGGRFSPASQVVLRADCGRRRPLCHSWAHPSARWLGSHRWLPAQAHRRGRLGRQRGRRRSLLLRLRWASSLDRFGYDQSAANDSLCKRCVYMYYVR